MKVSRWQHLQRHLRTDPESAVCRLRPAVL